MGPTAFRLLALVFGAAVLGGANCDPTGAQFSPTTGVLTYNGTAAGELVQVGVSGGAIVLNSGQIPIQGGVPTLTNTTRIVLNGREGDDYLAIQASVGAIPARLIGAAGADVLIGGAGGDEVHGGPGADVALLGDGDDSFVWSPGDEGDTVEGEAGFDTLASYGDDAAENVSAAALNGRVQWVRSAGPVTTDLAGIEQIDWFARGGADQIAVYEVAGTGLARVRANLTALTGMPDGQLDTLYVSGTLDVDDLNLTGGAGGIVVTGISATVEILGQDATDRLTVDLRSGADGVFSQVAAGAIETTFVGGLGEDLLIGGPGAEQFVGGDGNDSIMMEGGDDTFTWNPGDDLDLVDGGEGFDTMLFNGGNVGENIDVSALGGKVRFFRNVATVTTELDDVEAIDFIARGGPDFVFVNDLSGTDLVELHLELAGAAGGGDAAVDHVAVNGTGGDDAVQVFGDASLVSVVGLAAQVTIANADGPSDALTVQTFAGEDVVHAVGLTASAPTLTADGGDHADVLIGGDGADVLLGGEGDDLLQGGPGLDVLDGGPGNNIVVQ